MTRFAESIVEDAALAWLAGLGWQVTHGPEIAHGEPHAEEDALCERAPSDTHAEPTI